MIELKERLKYLETALSLNIEHEVVKNILGKYFFQFNISKKEEINIIIHRFRMDMFENEKRIKEMKKEIKKVSHSKDQGDMNIKSSLMSELSVLRRTQRIYNMIYALAHGKDIYKTIEKNRNDNHSNDVYWYGFHQCINKYKLDKIPSISNFIKKKERVNKLYVIGGVEVSKKEYNLLSAIMNESNSMKDYVISLMRQGTTLYQWLGLWAFKHLEHYDSRYISLRNIIKETEFKAIPRLTKEFDDLIDDDFN